MPQRATLTSASRMLDPLILDTELALGKGNRHLGDDEPVAHRAPGEIDLEAVALGVHAVQVNRFECFAAVRAVASGDVVDPDSERQARIGVSGFGQD